MKTLDQLYKASLLESAVSYAEGCPDIVLASPKFNELPRYEPHLNEVIKVFGMMPVEDGRYVKLSDVEALLEEQEHPFAYFIEYELDGVKRTAIPRHNAIADYREIDPNATCTPLYLRSKQ